MATSTTKEPIHVICYGDTGTGKSTFGATFPTPGLIFQFDPLDKSGPYLRSGRPQERQEGEFGPFRDVLMNKKDELKWRVEYFHDMEMGKIGKKGRPDGISAYRRFRNRVDRLYDELDQWRTIIVDSTTYMELAARKFEQYVLNADAVGQGKQQWWAGSTETMEEMLMCVFANFPCNVVVIAHLAPDKKRVKTGADNLVLSLNAPGRLGRTLPTGYGESYHAYVQEDDNDQAQFWLQTRSNDEFFAGSQIQAPNPCAPNYKALWVPETAAVTADPS